MAAGTFTNSGIGFGVAFTLKDYFTATANKIEGEMTSLESATDKMANKINSSFGKISAGAAMIGSGVAIVAPLMAAVNLSSDYAENMNKLDVAFGKYASDVKDFTDNTLQNFGIDKVASSDMASLFGDMSVGMGFAQKDAANLSMRMVGLAGDLASFKNISHDMAQTALKGVFTGETESLKGLGIVATQDNLKEFAKTQGITKPLEKMSQTEKVMLRFNFVMNASKNAVGDFMRTGEGFANVQRKMVGTFKELGVEIGDKIKPALTWLFSMVMGLTQMFVNFSKTGLGKLIINLALLGTVLTALTLIGVGVVMMFEALAGVMSTVFVSMLPIIFEVGLLVGGLVLLWSAIDSGSNALMLFASLIAVAFGPLGLLAVGVMVVVKAVKDFNAYMTNGMEVPNNGPITWFLKLGAILSFVGEVFSSMSDEGFTLSENLETALKKIGIFEFAIAIATWIGRIRAFFMGVWQGITEGAMAIFGVFQAIFGYFDSLIQSFGLFDAKLNKNKDSLEKWKQIGVYAGYAIAAVLGVIMVAVGLLALSWAAAGVMMIITWSPIILLVLGIIAVIWAAIWVFNHFGEIVTWVGELIWGTLTWVYDGFIWLFGFIFSLPSMMFNWGVDFVLNLWEGIKSMWGSLVAWLESMITGIWDTVTAPFKWLGDKIGGATDWITGADSAAEAGNISSAAVNEAAGLSNTMATNYGQQWSGIGGSTNTTTNNNTTTQPAVVNLQLDSDLIYSKMIDKQEMDNARKP